MESSDTPQNETARPRFQNLVGNRSQYYAQLVAQAEARRDTEKSYSRSRFWFAVRVSLGCLLTTGSGFLMMGWALHTTDVEKGRIAWMLGPIIGNTLTIALVGWAWMKWEGDDW